MKVALPNLRTKGITIGNYKIHRKEQWDIGQEWNAPPKPDIVPILCIHRNRPNQNTRVFCVWFWGIHVGDWWLTKKTVRRWFRSVVGRIAKFNSGV